MNKLRLLTALLLSGASLVFGQKVNSVVNAADTSTAFSPGMVVLIRGTSFSTTSSSIATLPAPTSFNGVSVRFTSADGSSSLLPIFSVSPSEIRAQLPYDIATGAATLTVGASTASLQVDALAPRLITNFADGSGDAMVYHTTPQRPVTRTDPALPGETLWFYGHGFGQTIPAVAAGADPGPDPSPAVTAPVTVNLDGLSAKVNSITLLEQNPGVYKVSVTLPYDNNLGTVPVLLTLAGTAAQTNAVLPLMPNGFYYQILANTTPAATGLNGVSGTSSALATRQTALNYWGSTGFNSWTKTTGLGTAFEPIRGLALTLRNGTTTVFANNGIEDKNGTFYSNANGGQDIAAPGLLTIFSNSNNFNFIGGGFLRLSSATTFDTVIGYFDGNGDRDLPLNPDSPYIKYRMNFWSNTSPANAPLESGSFTGNVWSTDSTSGTFSWSYTGVDRVFRQTATLASDPSRRDDPIFRLVYKMTSPVTLPAGDYWFSHDAIVPDLGAFSFPSADQTTPDAKLLSRKTTVTRGEPAAGAIRVQPPALLRINP